MASPMRPGLVIFDCDGLLVDSEPISQRVSLEMIAEHGVSMLPEEMAVRRPYVQRLRRPAG